MGKWDRPEWVPSEKDLIAELCNAREINWPVEALKHFDYRNEWLITAFCDYDEYMQGFLRDGRNYPEIPMCYMDSAADWRDTKRKKITLNYILNQIGRSPEEYCRYIMGMVDRYLSACEARLDGKWPADLWRKGPDGKEPSDSSPSVPSFTRACYRFCCPERVSDNDLLKKIIVLQKLQTLISERLRQGSPVEQGGKTGRDRQAVETLKWRRTSKELDELADGLQANGFVADAEEFTGQFDKADKRVEAPCQWKATDRSLGYLFDKLATKAALPSDFERTKAAMHHFLKKDGSPFTESFTQNMHNRAELSTKSKGFPEIDRLITEIFD